MPQVIGYFEGTDAIVLTSLVCHGYATQPISNGADRSGGAPSLTRRETEVLRLLGEGQSTAEASAALGVTDNTFRSHVRNILRKLGTHSRVEAVSAALQLRLI